MTKEHADTSHNTAKELEFLSGITEGLWVKPHSPERARKALAGYLKTANKRKWDTDVNITSCTSFAKVLLQTL